MSNRDLWIQIRRHVIAIIKEVDEFYAVQGKTTISEVADSTMTAVPEMIQTPTTE